jgi:hypothetical protein
MSNGHTTRYARYVITLFLETRRPVKTTSKHTRPVFILNALSKNKRIGGVLLIMIMYASGGQTFPRN